MSISVKLYRYPRVIELLVVSDHVESKRRTNKNLKYSQLLQQACGRIRLFSIQYFELFLSSICVLHNDLQVVVCTIGDIFVLTDYPLDGTLNAQLSD